MAHDHDDDGTVENRVYLFRELAQGWLSRHGELLSSPRDDERARALRALADLAFVSCAVADGGDDDAAEVARRIAKGP